MNKILILLVLFVSCSYILVNCESDIKCRIEKRWQNAPLCVGSTFCEGGKYVEVEVCERQIEKEPENKNSNNQKLKVKEDENKLVDEDQDCHTIKKICNASDYYCEIGEVVEVRSCKVKVKPCNPDEDIYGCVPDYSIELEKEPKLSESFCPPNDGNQTRILQNLLSSFRSMFSPNNTAAYTTLHPDDLEKEARRLITTCTDPEDTCPPTRTDWEEREKKRQEKIGKFYPSDLDLFPINLILILCVACILAILNFFVSIACSGMRYLITQVCKQLSPPLSNLQNNTSVYYTKVRLNEKLNEKFRNESTDNCQYPHEELESPKQKRLSLEQEQ